MRVLIPFSPFDTFNVSGLFYAFLTHAAVAFHLKGFGFDIALRQDAYRQEEGDKKNEYAFHCIDITVRK